MSNQAAHSTLSAPLPSLALGVLLTLISLGFIENYATGYSGVPFWDLLNQDDRPIAWILVGLLATLALIHRNLPPWLGELPEQVGNHPWIVAVTTVTVLSLLTLFAYHDFPLSMDEYAPWFQAKIFAAGKLTGRFPPDLIDHLISVPYQGHFFALDRQTGAVISTYWPGFALFLAPFMALGLPWLCNPVIVAATVCMIRRLALDMTQDRRTAGWATLLALASPALTLNGMSYYSMPAHLLASTTYVWLLLQPTARRCFLAGLVGAFALSLHNPYPHLVFMLPWILWVWLRGGHWQLLSLSTGYLLVGLPLVVGWAQFKATLIATTYASAHLPPLSGPLDTLLALVQNLFSAPTAEIMLARSGGLVKVWIWACPLLLPLAILGLRRMQHPALRYLAASTVTTLAAYYVIRFDQGMGWGYRYFHPAFLALPIFAAVAIRHLEKQDTSRSPWRELAAALAMGGLLLLTPLHAVFMERRVSMALESMPPSIPGRSLTVLTGKGYCALSRCDLLHNDPWLRGNIVLISRPPNNLSIDALERHFPGAFWKAGNTYGNTFGLPSAIIENKPWPR